VSDVTAPPGDDPDIAAQRGVSPDQVMLDELRRLLAGAQQQQTVLRESLATAVSFLDRSPD
jgi:hypothetical protein